MYNVYIKIDEFNRIIDINSDAFVLDVDGWILIDSGHGDKYHHAQGNYFNLPTMDWRGIYRYAYEPDAIQVWRERTKEEMDGDWEGEPSVPSRIDIIEAQVAYMAMMTDTLLGGVRL